MLLQHGDTLWYRDRAFDLMDEPLEANFTLISSRPDFVRSSAASRRETSHQRILPGYWTTSRVVRRLRRMTYCDSHGEYS
jgi:hypothetical protein